MMDAVAGYLGLPKTDLPGMLAPSGHHPGGHHDDGLRTTTLPLPASIGGDLTTPSLESSAAPASQPTANQEV